jgi:TonB family protein
MPKDPPSQSYGAASSRFWRNVTLIALAHIALIAGLIRWSVEARSSSNAQSIVWISGAEDLAARETESSESPQPAVTPMPSPESEPLKKDEAAEETAVVTAAKSEIELPSPTPTSTPKPTATPTAKPKETPGPTPKPARDAAPNVAGGPTPKPKKAVLAKTSPKPSPKAKPSPTKSAEKAKKTDANAEKKKMAKTAPAKGGSASQDGTGKTSSAGKGGHAGGGSSASEFGWYGNMLHDRFYSAWIQPTTTVASGSKISTLVKVRIEKDGRVSNFEIIKPSENVVVNESVAAVAKRVTEVDPPPVGLGNDHYDVNINFELNADQETVK